MEAGSFSFGSILKSTAALPPGMNNQWRRASMPRGKEANGFTPTELAGQIDLAATRFLRAFALAGGSMQDLQGWVEHPLMLAHALEASRDWAKDIVRATLNQVIEKETEETLPFRCLVSSVLDRKVPEEIKPYLLHLQERDFLTRNHTSDMVRLSIVTCKKHRHEDPCILIYLRLSERLVGHEGSHHTELRCRYAVRVRTKHGYSNLGVAGEDQRLTIAIQGLIRYTQDYCRGHGCGN